MASNSSLTRIATTKRAHKTLTIEQKVELLDKVGHTSYTVLCEEYGIGCSTITDIRKKETELRQYKRKMMEMGVNRQAKIMKLGHWTVLCFCGSNRREKKRFPSQGQYCKQKLLIYIKSSKQYVEVAQWRSLRLRQVGCGDFVNATTSDNCPCMVKSCLLIVQQLISLFLISRNLSMTATTAYTKSSIAMRPVSTTSHFLHRP